MIQLLVPLTLPLPIYSKMLVLSSRETRAMFPRLHGCSIQAKDEEDITSKGKNHNNDG